MGGCKSSNSLLQQQHYSELLLVVPLGCFSINTWVLGVCAVPCCASGAFPLWLAPVQVRLMPVNDAVVPYVQEVSISNSSGSSAGHVVGCSSRSTAGSSSSSDS